METLFIDIDRTDARLEICQKDSASMRNEEFHPMDCSKILINQIVVSNPRHEQSVGTTYAE